MYLLIPVQIYLLDRLSRAWSWKAYFVFVGSLLLWTNWHTFSSVLAYVIFASALLDLALKNWPRLPWKKVLGLAATFTVVGFIHPTWTHPVWMVQQFPLGEWAQMLTEMSKTDLSDYPILASVSAFFFLTFAFSVPMAVRNRSTGDVSYILILIYHATQVIRMVPITMAAGALSLARVASWNTFRHFQIILLVGAFVVAVLGFDLATKRTTFEGLTKFDQTKTGAGVFGQLNARDLQGNALNESGVGGYLMLFFPKVLVSIDSRSSAFYSLDDWKQSNQIAADENLFKKTILDKDVEFIAGRVLPGSVSLYTWTIRTKDFYPLAFDDHHFFWSKKVGARSLRAIFANPNCMARVSATEVESDLVNLQTVLNENSATIKTLKYVKGLVGGDLQNEPPTDIARRLLISKLRAKGDREKALHVSQTIVKPSLNDLLVYIDLRLESPQNREEVLEVLKLAMAYFVTPIETTLFEHLRDKLVKLDMNTEEKADLQKWLATLESQTSHAPNCQ